MGKKYHDWEKDPRLMRECLAEWMQERGFKNYREAAEVLGVNPTSFHGWRHGGRKCSIEKTLRKLMTALDRLS